jgi:3-methyladenine DNA glycosylase AlkC
LDYKKTIVILDNLYFDKSRFVTRSVANHLNDISKIDPNLVIDTLKKWKKSNKSKDIDYIISHSTRTLVKLGDKNTLEFLGYSTNPQIEIKNFNIINPEVIV